MAVHRRILRVLGWGAVGGLVGAFLIGYAAPYLPPSSFWWTNLFAVLVPSLGLVVGLLALGILGQGVYRGAWGRVAGAGLLLGFVVVRLGPYGMGDEAGGAAPDVLRVMTFNLPPTLVKDSRSATALRRLVRGEAPHVLALQESWVTTGGAPGTAVNRASASTRVLLADTMGYALPRVSPRRTTIQQPVLGRVVLDSMSVHPLPPDGKTDSRSRYTRTQFSWQGRSAVLYNVHLHTVGVRPWEEQAEWASLEYWQSFLRTYRTGVLRRAEQARRIRQRLEQESQPALVVGDFNSTPHQWAYQHIAAGLRHARGEGLAGATFPADWPLVRIDHILAGPAWEIVGARVPTLGAGTVSDHRPVVGRLRWRGD